MSTKTTQGEEDVQRDDILIRNPELIFNVSETNLQG